MVTARRSGLAVSCLLACVVSPADRDPSLEIKYRLKKPKEKEEKESEPEREEKPDGDGSSTPQLKTDKRRGSQVTWQPALYDFFLMFLTSSTFNTLTLLTAHFKS